MIKPTLVVLAAGLGSRYGGVKQMEGFGPNNEWLLEYSVYDAIQNGFGKVVFVLRDAIYDDFKDYFDARLPENIEREYVLQELDNLPAGFELPEGREKPWGTGHAVLVTKEAVNTPFAVINADDYYGPEAFEKLAQFLQSVNLEDNHYGMIGYQLKNTLSDNGSVARGVCLVDNNNYLNEVEEHTQIERQEDGLITNTGEGSQKTLSDDTIVSMNCWAFTPTIFDQIDQQFADFLSKRGQELKSEFYIPYVVQELMDEGKADVKVGQSNQKWFGVTYPEDKDAVVSELKTLQENGAYPQNLWED